jgi:hypothetical protein
MTRAAWLVLGAGTVVLAAGGALLVQQLQVQQQASKPQPPLVRVPARYAQLRQGHGHALHVDREGIECAKCHVVEHGFEDPGSEPCRECHAREAEIDHALGPGDARADERSADCRGCHAFSSVPEDTSWQCMPCHELPQGELHAVRVHTSKPCQQCHSPHAGDPIQPSACTSCHADTRNRHPATSRAHGAAGSGAEAGNCLTCHDGHSPAQLALERCTQCHDKPHALFAGHTECTSCHVPHAFEREAAAECTDCHTAKQALASPMTAAHRECSACHSPHHVGAASDAVCGSCHGGIRAQHPPTAAGATCIGCHQPHPARTALAAKHADSTQPCSHCHRADGERAFHGGRAECVACHRPHTFDRVAQAQVCAACHGEQTAHAAHNPGHARCADCHKGHPHAAELPPVACRECHKQPSVSAGHAQCTGCHEPHGGQPLALAQSCAHCHAQQHKRVDPGHAQCTACHAPHDATQAAFASCAQCHAQKRAAPHGQLAAGCEACHGVHAAGGARKAPACQSCHKRPTLPGLHAVAEHGECARCHPGAHVAPPWAARATCIGCHAAQKDHQPEAQQCQGCHVFRQ